MNIWFRWDVLYLFVFLAGSNTVLAGSFNCTLANSRVEKLICSDAEVRALDSELNSKYREMLHKKAKINELKNEQLNWLKSKRNYCQNKACLVSVYRGRISKLDSLNLSLSDRGGHVQRRYPPYPDVWGYELGETGKEKDGSDSPFVLTATMNVLEMPNGDYAISYRKGSQFKRGLLNFFEGKNIDVMSSYVDYLITKYPRAKTLNSLSGRSESIEIRGTKIHVVKELKESECPPAPYEVFLQKTDNRGQILAEVVVLFLHDFSQPSVTVSSKCWSYDFVRPQVGEVMHGRVQAIWPEIILLADGSFLLYANNIIIRLDENFNSRSEFINKRVFLVDRADIQSIWTTAAIRETNSGHGVPERDEVKGDHALYQFVTKLKQREGN